MPKLHAEPLIFCLVWALLAVAGGLSSIWLGILLSGGLAVILIPLSAAIISKHEDPMLEARVRWGILTLAAMAAFAYIAVQSTPYS